MNSPAERYYLASNNPESNAQAAALRALESFARSELQRQGARASDPGRFEVTSDSVQRTLRLAAEIAEARPTDRLTIGDPEDLLAQQHQYIVEAVERQALPRGHFHNAWLQSMVDDLLMKALSLADLPSISREDNKRFSDRARRVLRAAMRQLDLRTADRHQVFDINDDRIQSFIQQGTAAAQQAYTQATYVQELDLAFDSSWPDAPDTVRLELSELVCKDGYDPERIRDCLSIAKTSSTIVDDLVHRERERHNIDGGTPLNRHIFDDDLRKQWREFQAVWDKFKADIWREARRLARKHDIDEKDLLQAVYYRLHDQCLLRDRLCLGSEFAEDAKAYIIGSIKNKGIDSYREEQRRKKREKARREYELELLIHRRGGSEPSEDSDSLDRLTLAARRHTLDVLPSIHSTTHRDLADLSEELALSDITHETRRVCELMLELTSISIEIYERWMRDDRVKRAVHLLLLGEVDKPRAQMKRIKLLISEAYGEIRPPWFRRYGYELPQDKSKKQGAFGSLEGSDYHNFNHYVVGRKTGAHPIIQQGVRHILEEIFLDDLSFEVDKLLKGDRQEEQ